MLRIARILPGLDDGLAVASPSGCCRLTIGLCVSNELQCDTRSCHDGLAGENEFSFSMFDGLIGAHSTAATTDRFLDEEAGASKAQ